METKKQTPEKNQKPLVATLVESILKEKIKDIIIFDELNYIKTDHFSNHSWLTFGAFNSKIGLTQAVYYSPEKRMISFRLHSIKI